MNVIVIGETCNDVFVYGKVNRLSPEAPVPVFIPVRITKNSGMAGNVLVNVKSITKDANVHLLSQSGRITKTRYVDDKSNHMFIRIDEGDDKVQEINERQKSYVNFNDYDILIVSDYNKGFLTNEYIINSGNNSKCLSILDSKRKITFEMLESYDFVKVNEDEYLRNKEVIDSHNWNVLITLGKNGVMFKGEIFPSPKPLETIDVSGAGDTFTASFIVKFFETRNVDKSIEFANEMSSIVVSKKGVVTPL